MSFAETHKNECRMEKGMEHTKGKFGYGPVSGHIFHVASGVHIATMEGLHDDGPGPFRNPQLIKANAEFIVHAVNVHDDLLAACKTMLEAWECRQPAAGIVAIQKAIAKAEGEKPKEGRRCRECGRLRATSYFGTGEGADLCHDCHQANLV